MGVPGTPPVSHPGLPPLSAPRAGAEPGGAELLGAGHEGRLVRKWSFRWCPPKRTHTPTLPPRHPKRPATQPSLTPPRPNRLAPLRPAQRAPLCLTYPALSSSTYPATPRPAPPHPGQHNLPYPASPCQLAPEPTLPWSALSGLPHYFPYLVRHFPVRPVQHLLCPALPGLPHDIPYPGYLSTYRSLHCPVYSTIYPLLRPAPAHTLPCLFQHFPCPALAHLPQHFFHSVSPGPACPYT